MLCLQGLQKLTLLDYPGYVACTVFTGGCNFRCPFCQNSDLLVTRPQGQYTAQEILTFLEHRKNILDGVCISGGEPLLQENLPQFLQEVRKLGYRIKLDTNGSFPDILEQLVTDGLVDYVAMDIKNSLARYEVTTGTTGLYTRAVIRSVDFLLRGNVEYEFRTTVVKELHRPADLLELSHWIAGASRYYLQSFVDSSCVLEPGLHGYTAREMEELRQLILPQVPAAQLRGIG